MPNIDDRGTPEQDRAPVTFRAWYEVTRDGERVFVPVQKLTTAEFRRISARMRPEKVAAIVAYRARHGSGY